MKIIIDEPNCIGCGACEAIADDYYELIDDKAKVKKNPVCPQDKDRIDESVMTCPVQVITTKQ